jgi:hypothetical protein
MLVDRRTPGMAWLQGDSDGGACQPCSSLGSRPDATLHIIYPGNPSPDHRLDGEVPRQVGQYSLQEASIKIDLSQVRFEEILPLRELYRQEMNCQIVHDSLHARGFSDLYRIRVDGRTAGYGCVVGDRGKRKDMIREFYVLPQHRAAAPPLFRRLRAVSHARKVRAQINDVVLTLILFDRAPDQE